MTELAYNKTQRQLIGWRECAALPDLGIDFIDSKIDTGAKLSAIHAFGVTEVNIDGERHVEFFLHPVQQRKTVGIKCCEPVRDRRLIRSSNGREEERFVIRTHIELGDHLWAIDLTLTNRDAMDFQLLIGRNALGRKFHVNPAASYLLNR